MLSRLMTRREQALLGGLAFAIILGAISLHFHRDRIAAQEDVAAPVKIPVARAMQTAGSRSPTKKPPVRETAVSTPAIDAAIAPGHAPASGLPDSKQTSDLAVAAMGAVQREGLYRLPSGSRVNDLIEKAGGAAEQADLSEINLAAPLVDGTTLTLPKKPEWTQQDGVVRGLSGPRVSNPPQYLRAYSASAPAAPQAESIAAPSAPAKKKGIPSGAINLNTATAEELEDLPGVGPKTAQAIIDLRPYSTVDELLNVKGVGPKKMEQLRPLVTVP